MLSQNYANYVVSNATLQPKDIIVSILDFIKTLTEIDTEEIISKAEDCLQYLQDEDDVFIYEYEDLFDAMNDLAPRNCYFGSHVGDGACIGFWKIEED